MKTEILLFGGYEDLDAIGPLSVLSTAGFEVSVVTADSTQLVTSAGGVPVGPAGRLGSPQLLIVPGGGWNSRDPAGAWEEARRGVIPRAIAACAKEGATIASVCTGAMLLAKAGLLTGRPATTHHGAHADLEAAGARLIPGARVVDDGDLLTSAGVTAGLDLAIWLVERELGADAARAAERELEYCRGEVYRPAGGSARPVTAPGGVSGGRLP